MIFARVMDRGSELVLWGSVAIVVLPFVLAPIWCAIQRMRL